MNKIKLRQQKHKQGNEYHNLQMGVHLVFVAAAAFKGRTDNRVNDSGAAI